MSAEAVEANASTTANDWALSSFITTSWVNLIHVYLRSSFFFFSFFSHNSLWVSLASVSYCSVACLSCECMALCTNQIDVECMNCAEKSFCHAHNNVLYDGWMCAQFSCCDCRCCCHLLLSLLIFLIFRCVFFSSSFSFSGLLVSIPPSG